LDIIIEGKKEESIDNLSKKFEGDIPLIKTALGSDPTGYKYIDYISKQLEKYLPNTSPDFKVRLLGLIDLVIPWFHQNSGRIDKEILNKSRNKYLIAFDKDVENIDKIYNSPKDITNYPIYFLAVVKNIIQEIKTNKEKEKEAKSQVEKIYEDDTYLIVKPNTYEASCYYGANTKWCTASSSGSREFTKYTNEGDLYYFINKRTPTKMALFKEKDSNSKEIFDERDRRVTSKELLELFPLEITEELLGSGDLFKKLMQYTKGKVSRNDVEQSDDLIRSVYRADPLGASEVIIDFNDESDFFKILNIDDDDEHFAKSVTDNNWDFHDSYSLEEEFKEGYRLFGDLDEDNMEKMKYISSLMSMSKPFDSSDTESLIEFAEKLITLYPKEVNQMLSEWSYYSNRMMTESAEAAIHEEIQNYLKKFDFEMTGSFSTIKTTVGNLIWWFLRMRKEKTDLTVLLSKMFENSDREIGGWYQDQYSFENREYFDKDRFNHDISYYLDKIIEDIEDNIERRGQNPKDFLDMIERIRSKYKIGIWFDLPKNKKVKYRIDGFNPENLKIKLTMISPGREFKEIEVSEENFYHLLYQPELFEFGEV